MQEHSISIGGKTLIKNDGTSIDTVMNLTSLKDSQGNIIGLVKGSRETAGRKQLEKPLIESRDFLENIIKTSADGIIVTDSEGSIILINNAAERILGYSGTELRGKSTKEFIPSGNVAERGKELQKQLLFKGRLFGFEHKFHRRDGNIIDIEINVAPLKNEEGIVAGSVASFRDITERKAAEKKLHEYQDQLRSMASQLTLIEERERRQIAADLHDRIAQTLALTKIKLGTLQESVHSPDQKKDLHKIRELIDQTIQDTRSLTFDLCPPFLYELGFEKALEWLLEEIKQNYGIATFFENKGTLNTLGDEVSILLFRTIRELLINIVKHAKAHISKVSVREDQNHVYLTVEDDGIGFDTEKLQSYVTRNRGFGLFQIKERLHYLGGQMEVASLPTRGTKISLTVPIQYKKNSRQERRACV